MPQIFLISGLGADRRLFNNIHLPGYEYVHVDWLEPETHDTIHTYAQKLIQQYNILPGSTVVGVSLGGIMTVEISSIVPLHQAVIISSIKSATEFPWYFKLFRKVPLYKILPLSFYTTMGSLIKPLFGSMTQTEWQQFKSMLEQTSSTFMKWAMHAVLHWEPKILSGKIYHIMGTKDFIFSHKLIKNADAVVSGGTHDMVFKKGEEVSKILQSILIT
ncbi:alpha/beta hydrolase [Mucilaginibacter robiniae]|uniref:Alpha/beta hydrolase n=1 Tax=Mucilaginibacter robiniae TaxID=2728022 RepID=A0A7L5E3Z4_9SPHI|nr:alpha/beta hydrolase [Mucilaginibacter robiniae]QJD98040.1 alpha/beta hydrolase [Mucilaginibacter robiniae]